MTPTWRWYKQRHGQDPQRWRPWTREEKDSNKGLRLGKNVRVLPHWHPTEQEYKEQVVNLIRNTFAWHFKLLRNDSVLSSRHLQLVILCSFRMYLCVYYLHSFKVIRWTPITCKTLWKYWVIIKNCNILQNLPLLKIGIWLHLQSTSDYT